MQETPVQFLVQEDPLEKEQATHSSIFGLPLWLSGKESACNPEDTGNTGLILGLGRYPAAENGDPFQYSHLENLMDRGA